MSRNLEYRQSNEAVLDVVETILASRLDQAAMRLRQRVIENISRPNTDGPVSKAGAFPHKESGTLMSSISVETVDRLTRHVITDADHGLFLEMGTGSMAPRPYLTRTLVEMSAEIGATFAEGSADR